MDKNYYFKLFIKFLKEHNAYEHYVYNRRKWCEGKTNKLLNVFLYRDTRVWLRYSFEWCDTPEGELYWVNHS